MIWYPVLGGASDNRWPRPLPIRPGLFCVRPRFRMPPTTPSTTTPMKGGGRTTCPTGLVWRGREGHPYYAHAHPTSISPLPLPHTFLVGASTPAPPVSAQLSDDARGRIPLSLGPCLLTWPTARGSTGQVSRSLASDKEVATCGPTGLLTHSDIHPRTTDVGIKRFEDGEVYEGGFLDGKEHGPGICCAPASPLCVHSSACPAQGNACSLPPPPPPD